MEQSESYRAWLESDDGLKVPLLAYCRLGRLLWGGDLRLRRIHIQTEQRGQVVRHGVVSVVG